MNTGRANDPVLSEDFAERVLMRADRLVVQRRRISRVAGSLVAFSFVLITFASWTVLNRRPQPAQQQPAPVASYATAETQSDEQDALNDLFPDAAPVARFATDYADVTDGPDISLLSEDNTLDS
jgi:hypothetical protein